MKRLYRMLIDTLFISGFSILSWIILGAIFGKEVSSIFTVTYPIQAITVILKSIFGTGANIVTYKENQKEAVNTGLTVGIIVGFFIFLGISMNIDAYLNIMNVSSNGLKIFVVYSVWQMFFQYLLLLIIEKLYFEHQNKKANYYTIIYNMMQIFFIVILSILFHNPLITVLGTLFFSAIFIVYYLFKNLKISFRKFSLFKYIKYDATSIFSNTLFLITYFFGLSNSFQFGEKYVLAISFFTLITDVQWDISYNIDTLAKIDISQNNFNYKLHRKEGLKLAGILDISIVVLFFLLYPYYRPELSITLLFLIPTMIDFFIVIFYTLKKDYLQINYSPLKTTMITQSANILRTFCSFIKNPYCTLLGQEITIYLQLFLFYMIFKKQYKVNSSGKIEKVV